MVAAAPAVVDRAVEQPDFPDVTAIRQPLENGPSQGQGIGPPLVRGMEHQHPGPVEPGRREGLQPGGQLLHPRK